MSKYRIVTDNRMRDFGVTDFEKKTIKINRTKAKQLGKKSRGLGRKVKKGELTGSIYHEVYHANHPEASEKSVRKKEKQFLKKGTRKQKQKVYNLAQNQYITVQDKR